MSTTPQYEKKLPAFETASSLTHDSSHVIPEILLTFLRHALSLLQMVYGFLFIATLVFGAATYLMVASNQRKFLAQVRLLQHC
jgi:hypothetical protein